MPPGKLAAQVSHASMGAFFDATDMNWLLEEDNKYEPLGMTASVRCWVKDSFTKVVLRVDSEQELMDLYEKVKGEIPCSLIKDAGRTVFKEPTLTCLGIGPAEVDDIDKLVGHLKLY